MQQLLLELQPAPAPSLDNFVIGDNGAALAALRQWLTAPESATCLLLWGEAGSGRSHLLAASGAACTDAVRQPDLDTLPDAMTRESRLAVDNVEALSPAGEVALFNAYNRLRAAGGRLLVSAGSPPQGLKLREELRTRLASGPAYRLAPLSDADKARALRARAGARAFELSDAVLSALFARARRDMGTLSALVDALDRYTLEQQRPLTLPLLRQLLADHPGSPNP